MRPTRFSEGCRAAAASARELRAARLGRRHRPVGEGAEAAVGVEVDALGRRATSASSRDARRDRVGRLDLARCAG